MPKTFQARARELRLDVSLVFILNQFKGGDVSGKGGRAGGRGGGIDVTMSVTVKTTNTSDAADLLCNLHSKLPLINFALIRSRPDRIVTQRKAFTRERRIFITAARNAR